MFTESKIIRQITIQPESGAINVQWANQVLKDGEVISETFERKAYSADMAGFNTEVGALDVNAFLAAFNTESLAAKDEAIAAKATAEAELAAKDAEIAALEMQVVALTPVPSTDPYVDDLQIRLALSQVGLRDAVEAAVAAGDQDLKDWWQRARKVYRSNPMVAAMAAGLGIADEQVDNLFALAATK